MDARNVEARHVAVTSIIFIALLISALLIMTGCSSSTLSSTAQSSSKEHSILKVGVQNNALSIPTVYAYENDYFSDMGVDVELTTFVNGAEENKALEKGEIDMASNGLASVYMLASGNFSWIGESDNASSTIGIYVKEGSAPTQYQGMIPDNPEIFGSADSLKGLIVVGPAATMEEWVAVSYFAQFGLTAGTDYEFIPMDRTTSVESMLDGTADVFIATDADYARLMEDNGFVAIAEGPAATGIQFNNGYIVSNKALENKHDDVVAFLTAVYKASIVLNNDPALWNDFAYSYYQQNGKPATMEDVKKESELRAPMIPSDFEDPDYQLGSGVLSVGRFLAGIGAIEQDQVLNIEQSLDPTILEEALGLNVQSAVLPKQK